MEQSPYQPSYESNGDHEEHYSPRMIKSLSEELQLPENFIINDSALPVQIIEDLSPNRSVCSPEVYSPIDIADIFLLRDRLNKMSKEDIISNEISLSGISEEISSDVDNSKLKTVSSRYSIGIMGGSTRYDEYAENETFQFSISDSSREGSVDWTVYDEESIDADSVEWNLKYFKGTEQDKLNKTGNDKKIETNLSTIKNNDFEDKPAKKIGELNSHNKINLKENIVKYTSKSLPIDFFDKQSIPTSSIQKCSGKRYKPQNKKKSLFISDKRRNVKESIFDNIFNDHNSEYLSCSNSTVLNKDNVINKLNLYNNHNNFSSDDKNTKNEITSAALSSSITSEALPFSENKYKNTDESIKQSGLIIPTCIFDFSLSDTSLNNTVPVKTDDSKEESSIKSSLKLTLQNELQCAEEILQAIDSHSLEKIEYRNTIDSCSPPISKSIKLEDICRASNSTKISKNPFLQETKYWNQISCENKILWSNEELDDLKNAETMSLKIRNIIFNNNLNKIQKKTTLHEVTIDDNENYHNCKNIKVAIAPITDNPHYNYNSSAPCGSINHFDAVSEIQNLCKSNLINHRYTVDHFIIPNFINSSKSSIRTSITTLSSDDVVNKNTILSEARHTEPKLSINKDKIISFNESSMNKDISNFNVQCKYDNVQSNTESSYLCLNKVNTIDKRNQNRVQYENSIVESDQYYAGNRKNYKNEYFDNVNKENRFNDYVNLKKHKTLDSTEMSTANIEDSLLKVFNERNESEINWFNPNIDKNIKEETLDFNNSDQLEQNKNILIQTLFSRSEKKYNEQNISSHRDVSSLETLDTLPSCFNERSLTKSEDKNLNITVLNEQQRCFLSKNSSTSFFQTDDQSCTKKSSIPIKIQKNEQESVSNSSYIYTPVNEILANTEIYFPNNISPTSFSSNSKNLSLENDYTINVGKKRTDTDSTGFYLDKPSKETELFINDTDEFLKNNMISINIYNNDENREMNIEANFINNQTSKTISEDLSSSILSVNKKIVKICNDDNKLDSNEISIIRESDNKFLPEEKACMNNDNIIEAVFKNYNLYTHDCLTERKNSLNNYQLNTEPEEKLIYSVNNTTLKENEDTVTISEIPYTNIALYKSENLPINNYQEKENDLIVKNIIFKNSEVNEKISTNKKLFVDKIFLNDQGSNDNVQNMELVKRSTTCSPKLLSPEKDKTYRDSDLFKTTTKRNHSTNPETSTKFVKVSYIPELLFIKPKKEDIKNVTHSTKYSVEKAINSDMNETEVFDYRSKTFQKTQELNTQSRNTLNYNYLKDLINPETIESKYRDIYPIKSQQVDSSLLTDYNELKVIKSEIIDKPKYIKKIEDSESHKNGGKNTIFDVSNSNDINNDTNNSIVTNSNPRKIEFESLLLGSSISKNSSLMTYIDRSLEDFNYEKEFTQLSGEKYEHCSINKISCNGHCKCSASPAMCCRQNFNTTRTQNNIWSEPNLANNSPKNFKPENEKSSKNTSVTFSSKKPIPHQSLTTVFQEYETTKNLLFKLESSNKSFKKDLEKLESPNSVKFSRSTKYNTIPILTSVSGYSSSTISSTTSWSSLNSGPIENTQVQLSNRKKYIPELEINDKVLNRKIEDNIENQMRIKTFPNIILENNISRTLLPSKVIESSEDDFRSLNATFIPTIVIPDKRIPIISFNNQDIEDNYIKKENIICPDLKKNCIVKSFVDEIEKSNKITKDEPKYDSNTIKYMGLNIKQNKAIYSNYNDFKDSKSLNMISNTSSKEIYLNNNESNIYQDNYRQKNYMNRNENSALSSQEFIKQNNNNKKLYNNEDDCLSIKMTKTLSASCNSHGTKKTLINKFDYTGYSETKLTAKAIRETYQRENYLDKQRLPSNLIDEKLINVCPPILDLKINCDQSSDNIANFPTINFPGQNNDIIKYNSQNNVDISQNALEKETISKPNSIHQGLDSTLNIYTSVRNMTPRCLTNKLNIRSDTSNDEFKTKLNITVQPKKLVNKFYHEDNSNLDQNKMSNYKKFKSRDELYSRFRNIDLLNLENQDNKYINNITIKDNDKTKVNLLKDSKLLTELNSSIKTLDGILNNSMNSINDKQNHKDMDFKKQKSVRFNDSAIKQQDETQKYNDFASTLSTNSPFIKPDLKSQEESTSLNAVDILNFNQKQSVNYSNIPDTYSLMQDLNQNIYLNSQRSLLDLVPKQKLNSTVTPLNNKSYIPTSNKNIFRSNINQILPSNNKINEFSKLNNNSVFSFNSTIDSIKKDNLVNMKDSISLDKKIHPEVNKEVYYQHNSKALENDKHLLDNKKYPNNFSFKREISDLKTSRKESNSLNDCPENLNHLGYKYTMNDSIFPNNQVKNQNSIKLPSLHTKSKDKISPKSETVKRVLTWAGFDPIPPIDHNVYCRSISKNTSITDSIDNTNKNNTESSNQNFSPRLDQFASEVSYTGYNTNNTMNYVQKINTKNLFSYNNSSIYSNRDNSYNKYSNYISESLKFNKNTNPYMNDQLNQKRSECRRSFTTNCIFQPNANSFIPTESLDKINHNSTNNNNEADPYYRDNTLSLHKTINRKYNSQINMREPPLVHQNNQELKILNTSNLIQRNLSSYKNRSCIKNEIYTLPLNYNFNESVNLSNNSRNNDMIENILYIGESSFTPRVMNPFLLQREKTSENLIQTEIKSNIANDKYSQLPSSPLSNGSLVDIRHSKVLQSRPFLTDNFVSSKDLADLTTNRIDYKNCTYRKNSVTNNKQFLYDEPLQIISKSSKIIKNENEGKNYNSDKIYNILSSSKHLELDKNRIYFSPISSQQRVNTLSHTYSNIVNPRVYIQDSKYKHSENISQVSKVLNNQGNTKPMSEGYINIQNPRNHNSISTINRTIKSPSLINR